MRRLLSVLIAAGGVVVDSSSLEHRWRYEGADIAKLATLTRIDHSTIFFHGHTKSGYVRDGQFHPLVLPDVKESRDVRGLFAVSTRDGRERWETSTSASSSNAEMIEPDA